MQVERQNDSSMYISATAKYYSLIRRSDSFLYSSNVICLPIEGIPFYLV